MALTGQEFTKNFNAALAAQKPVKPKVNTGASQGLLGTIQSLGRGGQKANLGALSRNLVNFGGEASGVYDINRGVNEIKKGNVVGGLGRIGLGAVGFVPGVGAVSKAVSGASKVARASRFVTAASKARPVVALAGSRPVALAEAALRPLAKVNTGLQKVADFAYNPLYNAKTPVGRFVSPLLTSPAIVAGSIGQTIQGFTAPVPSNVAGATPPVQGPGLDGRDQLPPTPPAPGNPPAPGMPGMPKAPATGGGGATPPPAPAPGTGPGEPPAPGVNSGTDVSGYTGGFGNLFSTSGDVGGANIATGGGTVSTGGVTVGVPGAVQVAGADYNAALAANAANSAIRQASIRDALAQGIEGVQSGAADILGGRSQAILGQGITGQRRNYATGIAGETQRSISDQEASRNAYNAAVNQAYSDQAQAILDAARARSEQAARIRQIG